MLIRLFCNIKAHLCLLHQQVWWILPCLWCLAAGWPLHSVSIILPQFRNWRSTLTCSYCRKRHKFNIPNSGGVVLSFFCSRAFIYLSVMVINLHVMCVSVMMEYRILPETQQTHLLSRMTSIMEKPIVKVWMAARPLTCITTLKTRQHWERRALTDGAA